MRKKKLFEKDKHPRTHHSDKTEKENQEHLEIEEIVNEKEKHEIEKLKLEMEFYSLDPKPSFLEIVCYCYCYIGILTGPYFKYRTYKDWLHFKQGSSISILSTIASRSKLAPFIIFGFLFLSKFISFEVTI
jgi:lysophospholipid acyltransferase 7